MELTLTCCVGFLRIGQCFWAPKLAALSQHDPMEMHVSSHASIDLVLYDPHCQEPPHQGSEA